MLLMSYQKLKKTAKMNIPELDQEYFCIVNIDEYILAALVCSYINKPGKYTSMYQFPFTTTYEDGTESDIVDEHQMSRSRAREYSIKVHNVIRRIRGCKYLILVGLTDEQKSYIPYLFDYNVIEIQNISDIEMFLTPIVSKTETMEVKKEDVVKSLFLACRNNLILKINENALKNNVEHKEDSDIIIVIENHEETSTVIAINYALSIKSNITIIEKPSIDIRQVESLIEDWQEGNVNAYNDLSAMIFPNIEHINFKDYNFATFFTIGIPYSLIIKNTIPITHVNMHLYPDFFIFNNIYFEKNEQLSSAVVFSPEEFDDEETNFTISKLEKNNFYIQKLTGKEATANSLDFHIKEFPFDLLHICSHGGEINGYNISESFIDSNGNSHTVEYDEVVTFSPKIGDKLIKVTTKILWRKFNGFVWRSTELKQQNYPHYVYSEMMQYIRTNNNKNRVKKNNIFGSCAIKCSDFNYQAMFNILAASQSPVIFNNTCWSWSRISESFLAVGARCYIGTVWAVENNTAKSIAENFYENLENNSIAATFFNSQKLALGTKNENIYLIWGLHFSTLKKGNTIEESKTEITRKLLQSLSIWKDKFENTKEASIKKNIEELIEWNADLISKFFKYETLKIIVDSKQKN